MIYILSNDVSENSRLLDDNSLDEMISACAINLVNAATWTKDLRDPIIPKSVLKQHADKAVNVESIKTHEIPKCYDEWVHWCRECLANYNALLAYAKACCDEYSYRFLVGNPPPTVSKNTKDFFYRYSDVIVWASENKPDLPDELYSTKHTAYEVAIEGKRTHTPFPLVIPEKYWVIEDPIPVCDLVASHRAYYKAKLRKISIKNVKCHECRGTGKSLIDEFPCCSCNAEGYITYAPTWTRREIPEWLGDL